MHGSSTMLHSEFCEPIHNDNNIMDSTKLATQPIIMFCSHPTWTCKIYNFTAKDKE